MAADTPFSNIARGHKEKRGWGPLRWGALVIVLVAIATLWAFTKVNPLADWSQADVWHYIRTFDVPYNALHDRFFPSIGCEPCTRAIALGEDVRAGRWWWESEGAKECGLHLHPAAETTLSSTLVETRFASKVPA